MGSPPPHQEGLLVDRLLAIEPGVEVKKKQKYTKPYMWRAAMHMRACVHGRACRGPSLWSRAQERRRLKQAWKEADAAGSDRDRAAAEQVSPGPQP